MTGTNGYSHHLSLRPTTSTQDGWVLQLKSLDFQISKISRFICELITEEGIRYKMAQGWPVFIPNTYNSLSSDYTLINMLCLCAM